MKATHTDYMHPNHLRVEMDGDVCCMAPSHSCYAKLSAKKLPSFGSSFADRFLPRHKSCMSMRGAA